MTKTQDLTVEQKEAVLNRALKVLDEKFYQPEKLGNRWKDAIARQAVADQQRAAAEITDAQQRHVVGSQPLEGLLEDVLVQDGVARALAAIAG